MGGRLRSAANAASARAVLPITLSQSPNAGCRNIRTDAYQGIDSPLRPYLDEATYGIRAQGWGWIKGFNLKN